eukprot:622692_1
MAHPLVDYYIIKAKSTIKDESEHLSPGQISKLLKGNKNHYKISVQDGKLKMESGVYGELQKQFVRNFKGSWYIAGPCGVGAIQADNWNTLALNAGVDAKPLALTELLKFKSVDDLKKNAHQIVDIVDVFDVVKKGKQLKYGKFIVQVY